MTPCVASEQYAVRQNASSLARRLENPHQMQQVRIVSLFSGWDAEVLEPVVRIIGGVQPGAPAFVAERWIDDCEIKRLQTVTVFELRIGDCIALDDQGGRLVMQDHVHAGQTRRGGILLLAVQRDFHVFAVTGFITDFQQQRTGTTGEVQHGRVIAGFGRANAHNLSQDAADFCGRLKLAFALTALGGKVPHEVFVRIAQNVIAVRPVLREVQGRVFKDGDQVREPIDFFLTVAQFGGVIEVRHVGQVVGLGQRSENLQSSY